MWNLRYEKESDLPGVTWPQLMSSDSCPCPARLSTWLCWGNINYAPFVLFALALILSTGMKRHTISVLLTLFCFADSLSKYCLNAAPLAVGSRNNIYSVKKAKAVTWLISVFRSAKWEHTKLLCSSCLFSFASRDYDEVQGPTYPERCWNLSISHLENCSLLGSLDLFSTKMLHWSLDYETVNVNLTHFVNSLPLGFLKYKMRCLDKKLPDI